MRVEDDDLWTYLAEVSDSDLEIWLAISLDYKEAYVSNVLVQLML
jgi:hypothetical protein